MPSRTQERIVQLLQDLHETDTDGGSPAASPSPVPRVAGPDLDDHYDLMMSEGDNSHDYTDLTVDEDQAEGLRSSRGHAARGRHSGYLLERIENDYRARISELELKMSQESRDQAALRIAHEDELMERDREIENLRNQLEVELKTVLERQAQVEATAPAIQGQMQAIRSQLPNLVITEAQYIEIMQISRERRLLVDDVKAAVYETQKSLRQEVAQLRSVADTSRESSARAEQEMAQLRRENARISSAAMEREKEAEQHVEAMQARCERLSAELEEVTVRGEILSAKGGMYDDLRAKCEKLEEDNQKLQATETALKLAKSDVEEIRRSNREREHTLEMLMMDKAYLSKEVESLSDRQQRLEAELDAKSEKVSALKKARQDLYDKLLAGETSEASKYERRLGDEVARIQTEATSHIERIRKESTEMFERETRLLRELRDTAQQEASCQSSNLKAFQGQYDDLMLQHRDLQKRSDLKQTELQAELKMKGFELDRLRVEFDEKDTALKQATLQLEMLQEKVRVLTENYYNLESEKHRRTADLESQLVACQERLGQYDRMESEIDSAVLQGGDDNNMQSMLDGALPLAVRRRVKQSLQLAARVSRLEAERLELAREKDTAVTRAESLENDLAVLRGRTKLLGQPQTFLLDQLEEAEKRVKDSEMLVEKTKNAEKKAHDQLKQLQQEFEQKFEEKENQCRMLAGQKAAMRQDMERLLNERGQLESMRAMLSTAVQGAQWRKGPYVSGQPTSPHQHSSGQNRRQSGQAVSSAARHMFR